jgi:hypothetical protein
MAEHDGEPWVVSQFEFPDANDSIGNASSQPKADAAIWSPQNITPQNGGLWSSTALVADARRGSYQGSIGHDSLLRAWQVPTGIHVKRDPLARCLVVTIGTFARCKPGNTYQCDSQI